jgi:hypothetical protein
MLPFQSLHTAEFVCAKHPLILFGQFRSLAIQGIDILYFLIKLLVGNLIQPVANQVRFEIALFLKASPPIVEVIPVQVGEGEREPFQGDWPTGAALDTCPAP